MTSVSQPVYTVFIQADGEHIGETIPTLNLPEAKARLLNFKAIYPESALMVRCGDEWEQIADDNLCGLIYAHTIQTLALIVSKNKDLPLIGWRLAAWQPDVLEGLADDRETVQAYADVLGVEVTEQERPNHTTIRAAGVFLGVKVEVSAYIHADEAQAVA